jgi:hypothetical protein
MTAASDAPVQIRKVRSAEEIFGWSEAMNLERCARWHIARSRTILELAEDDLTSMFGYLRHDRLNTRSNAALKEMHTLEEEIASMQPKTIVGAEKMLEIALAILAHAEKDPDSALSEGPVLQIVRNVCQALEYGDGLRGIGEKAAAA